MDPCESRFFGSELTFGQDHKFFVRVKRAVAEHPKFSEFGRKQRFGYLLYCSGRRLGSRFIRRTRKFCNCIKHFVLSIVDRTKSRKGKSTKRKSQVSERTVVKARNQKQVTNDTQQPDTNDVSKYFWLKQNAN